MEKTKVFKKSFHSASGGAEIKTLLSRCGFRFFSIFDFKEEGVKNLLAVYP